MLKHNNLIPTPPTKSEKSQNSLYLHLYLERDICIGVDTQILSPGMHRIAAFFHVSAYHMLIGTASVSDHVMRVTMLSTVAHRCWQRPVPIPKEVLPSSDFRRSSLSIHLKRIEGQTPTVK
mmetsp:Transcript_30709/g.74146  ORF Transcript_30709/g.74146 Transcript_30709/m.74146 type:complete len:121 (-) Transcript_30709:1504-1866(-)